MSSYKGILISFEGGDGSGKSTHAELFKNYLDSKGLPFFTTREPGGTDFSEAVRALTKDTRFSEKSEISELLLFESARADIVKKRIIPALEQGDVVVMDRFFDSTTAYQSFGRGIPRDVVDSANAIATYGIKPDITFYMRIEPQAAFERRGGIDPSDAMEIAGMAFHNRVMQGFDQLAKENPDRFVTIDTTKSVDEVFQKIVSTFDSRWKRRKKEG